MAVPTTPGIGILARVQGLCMRQNIRLAELLIGFEQKNRFKVPHTICATLSDALMTVLTCKIYMQIMEKPMTLDPSHPLPDEISQQLPPLFFAIEESDCLARQCCHQNRGFSVSLNTRNNCCMTHVRSFSSGS